MSPQLSVITINKNNQDGLRRTIESVVSQTWKDFEFLVIDGASTDGSKDIIQGYANRLNYWVSEPDTGIYNAMNKGIQKATGEYCLFLNSGDLLATPDALYSVFSRNIQADIIWCDYFQTSDGTELIYTATPEPDQITLRTFIDGSLPHPSSFIHQSLFDSIGMYDESFKIISDWVFFLDAVMKHNCTLFHLAIGLSIFDTNGVSSTPSNRDSIKTDRDIVLNQRYLRHLPDYTRLHFLENVWQSRGVQFLYAVNCFYRKIRLAFTPTNTKGNL